MLPTSDRVRLLAAQGVDPVSIAVRLGLEPEVVSSILYFNKRRAVGRPSSPHRCKHCGAPPCKQRPIKTTADPV